MLPADALGDEGRKVKCSSCSHVWHQEPVDEKAERRETKKRLKQKKKDKAASKNLPALSRITPSGFGQKLLFIILLAAFGAAYLLHNRDIMPQLPEMFGMRNTDGLVFNDFSVERQRDGNRLTFTITGEILNNSGESQLLPDILVTVLSKGDRVMAQDSIVMNGRSLAVGESFLLDREINNISGNAYQIRLDIGDKWELFFR